jgi:TDG/mug DNA glycosylase family protein
MNPSKPTREIQAAAGKSVPDDRPNLKVLFADQPGPVYGCRRPPLCQTRQPLLACPVRSQLHRPAAYPYEATAAGEGCGITNLVNFATATADGPGQLLAGGRQLAERFAIHPGYLAVVSIRAYRTAFDRPKAGLGLQPETMVIPAVVLPNPSGLNAHYRPEDFASLFRGSRHSRSSTNEQN